MIEDNKALNNTLNKVSNNLTEMNSFIWTLQAQNILNRVCPSPCFQNNITFSNKNESNNLKMLFDKYRKMVNVLFNFIKDLNCLFLF